jgi:hypothetical protein
MTVMCIVSHVHAALRHGTNMFLSARGEGKMGVAKLGNKVLMSTGFARSSKPAKCRSHAS